MVGHSQSGSQPDASVLGRFVLGFDGTTLPEQLATLLDQGLAGVAIFERNFESPAGLRALTRQIRRAAGRPVLIGIDQEGGTRFALKEPFTVWPAPTEIGRLDDLKLVERMAQAMALELRAAGCNLDFAPMLDLHLNTESPITRARSFAAEPQRVARLGAAFIRGLRRGGVLACAKHYPGHGDTTVDPHLDLPVFDGSFERLQAMELLPFNAAVEESVPFVMTAHILLPDVDSEQPASLSRRLLAEVLRQRMSFRGVILADDLGMGAIARRYGVGEAAVLAFQAGSDLALLCHDWSLVEPALAGVEKARAQGRFSDLEWQASRARVARACARAEEATGLPPSLDVVGCREHRALAAEMRARLAKM